MSPPGTAITNARTVERVLGTEVNAGSTGAVDHPWIMVAARDWNELVAGSRYFFTAPRNPSWTVWAECLHSEDPDIFFQDTGRDAQRVCRSCPVRMECLRTALANGERYGIWGGLAPRERRQLTSARRRLDRQRREREA